MIPALQGVLADAIGMHHCFILPAVCYLYIAWYGLKGHAADAQASRRPQRRADRRSRCLNFRVVIGVMGHRSRRALSACRFVPSSPLSP